MTGVELLDANGDRLTEEEIRRGLEGNLCRCTGYQHIVDAVQAAARGDAMATQLEERRRRASSARAIKRVEDPLLITGAAKYVDDLKLPGMAHVAVLRSPYAHARIKAIDTSKAAAPARRRSASTPARTSSS